MLATSKSNVVIANILKASGANIDVESLSASQSFEADKTGFNNILELSDLLLPQISEDIRAPGSCKHIDQIRLPDGRCVHNSTRDARRVLMTLLNRNVVTYIIVLPTQSSGTCWFFATLFQTLVSQRGKIALLSLRNQ